MAKKQSFEESLLRLNEIVSLLERNDISLEESLKLFEEGAKISSECYDILKKSEQKITDISQKVQEKIEE